MSDIQGASHTAQPMPRKSPRGPSFCRMTFTPWKTPRYFFAASPFFCNSPCNCNLRPRPDALAHRPNHGRNESRRNKPIPNLDRLKTMRHRDSSTCCNPPCDERSEAHSPLVIEAGFGLYRSNAPYCRGHRDPKIKYNRRPPLAERICRAQPIAGRTAVAVKRVLRN